MSESLIDFFQKNPFWAILIIIFMILPIAGAIMHIVLKTFGRRGIDNAPDQPEPPPIDHGGNGLPDDKSENRDDNTGKA